MADAPNEVDIKIKADGNSAVVSISRVTKSLKGISDTVLSAGRSIGRFMSAFSKINWIMSSVTALISLFKSLREWMDRAATAARELADRLERDSIAAAAANGAEAYKRLNRELAETNRLERERNAILDRRRATERDLEDASLEREKQLAIASLDPASDTYADDRRAVERRFARRSAEAAARRGEEDARAEASRLYGEAESKDHAADRMQREYGRASRTEERARERSWRLAMAARGGDEEAKRKAAEADEEWKKAHDAAKEIRDAMDALRREADSLRNQAGELAGGGYSARITNEAAQMRITNEERAEAAQKERREKDEARREAERNEQEARREAERKEQEARREAERKERERVAAEVSANRDRISVLGAIESGMESADAVSQNRLTAMGLGSGVSAHGGVAGDVRKIIDLLKEEIAATKENKPAPDGGATFGE